MERKIIFTEDGSHTIAESGKNVTFHSIHGAIQESVHVFIDAGFKYIIIQLQDQQVNIFEMGLGTGLNVLLTFIEAEKLNQKIYYEAIEEFPLKENEAKELNYCEQLGRSDLKNIFLQLHTSEWEKEIHLSSHFIFKKYRTSLLNFSSTHFFDLIYFDAFAPKAQPELWTEEIFKKMFSILTVNGILVTYCSKGSVRRAMFAADFVVEKIPGAQGKREMMRAVKMV
jgi:tRNA U34 5-methylaminomethyl-2-thiouridine-forming methyltransferase MnmC